MEIEQKWCLSWTFHLHYEVRSKLKLSKEHGLHVILRYGDGKKCHLKFDADIEQTLTKDFKWMSEHNVRVKYSKQGKPYPMNLMILLTFGFAQNRSMKEGIVETLKLMCCGEEEKSPTDFV